MAAVTVASTEIATIAAPASLLSGVTSVATTTSSTTITIVDPTVGSVGVTAAAVAATAAVESFHRLPLELPCVPFSSHEGRRLFTHVLTDGTYINNYFTLTEQFLTQPTLTFCGMTTLVVILNSLQIDPGRHSKQMDHSHTLLLFNDGMNRPSMERYLSLVSRRILGLL
jgi:hypothetical protein